MFCPKCGGLNVEQAKYCRACGADISLVPQALTHTLPEAAHGVVEIEERGRRGRRYKFKEPPTFERGLSNVFKGMAFLLIVLGGYFYFFGAILFWVWFIIPAFSHIGEGIGQIIRSGKEPAALPPAAPFMTMMTPPAPLAPPRDTSEIAAPALPPSVTEGTTRHLDAAKN